jgi:hypothetical protein
MSQRIPETSHFKHFSAIKQWNTRSTSTNSHDWILASNNTNAPINTTDRNYQFDGRISIVLQQKLSREAIDLGSFSRTMCRCWSVSKRKERFGSVFVPGMSASELNKDLLLTLTLTLQAIVLKCFNVNEKLSFPLIR